ncbi:MAG: translation initiation factor IF-2 [Planctomycetota bacterium]|nr:MAG: translation initiation factor IF-2 [Planctomycetota bacterium]
MPVRIYALAKELKLDSKVLVEICTNAGVTGKGSALASLTDEEVEKVKAFIAGGGQSGKAPAAKARPSAGATADTTPEVVRREDYIAPGGTAPDKVPVLPERKKKKPAGEAPPEKPTAPKPAVPKPAAIKLAPMPEVAQPEPEPEPEVEAQKPDLRLPMDSIRAAGRGGSKPLIDHVRKTQGKRRDTGDTEEPQKPTSPRERSRSRHGSGGDGPTPQRGRRGGKGTFEEPSMPVGREQRQLNRRRASESRRGDDDEAPPRRRSSSRTIRRTGANTAAPRKSKVTLELPCTVRSFSEAIGLPAQQVLRHLLELGTMGNINSEIEPETAELLAVELGVEVDFKHEVDLAEQALNQILDEPDDPASLEPRPPVVTFLGHVDHGKTSLLDRIIGTDVVSGESGGITQHIRAYQVDKDGRKVSFVDTPGHEAFTEMRARGANVTDIAVLVVAADDGVMPQTEEAISHAKAAEVPIVVALNKIDLPGADPDRIYQQLAAAELLPTEWGGDTEVIKTSATVGTGIDDLLETLLTLAELRDYRANPNRAATGTCLEAELHEGRGVVSKVIVQNGTLKVGDALVCGSAFGRVKAMYDTLRGRNTYDEVGPSMPVNMTGLDVAPDAGEHFYVLPDIATAREIAEDRAGKTRRATLGVTPQHVTLENLFDRLGEKETQTLNIILRADVRGSIEAIQKELTKLVHPEVKIKVLQATVGGVTEADVHLADASDAVIIGFNVVPDENARALADARGVQIRRYEIIYKVTEDLKAALEGMLEPEQREVDLGRALVQRTFSISRVGTIAGCRVLAGVVQRNCRVRLTRDSRIIGDYPLESLRREKDDAREVREGLECGIKLGGYNDLKDGDILEFYKVEEVARTF